MAQSTAPAPAVIDADALMGAIARLADRAEEKEETRKKEARRQHAERCAEYSSWRHLEKLPGVVSVTSELRQEDSGQVDDQGHPKIKSSLHAEAVLEGGKIVTADAPTDAQLKDLLIGRVREALGMRKRPEARAPWTPLAKEFGRGGV